MKLIIINGPNLNMLGFREKTHYGSLNYENLKLKVEEYASDFDKVLFVQSNFEGEIINYIHQAVLEDFDALIINPGAYSHYSYAIYDALLIFPKIKVEVHLSDVLNRDEFRKKLVTSLACDHVISGLYEFSYFKAIDYIKKNRK